MVHIENHVYLEFGTSLQIFRYFVFLSNAGRQLKKYEHLSFFTE